MLVPFETGNTMKIGQGRPWLNRFLTPEGIKNAHLPATLPEDIAVVIHKMQAYSDQLPHTDRCMGGGSFFHAAREPAHDDLFKIGEN